MFTFVVLYHDRSIKAVISEKILGSHDVEEYWFENGACNELPVKNELYLVGPQLFYAYVCTYLINLAVTQFYLM